MTTRILPLLPFLSLLFLFGCIPLYMAGARAAVSTVAGVTSRGRAAGPPAAAQVTLPQEPTALLELYQQCISQRATTPGLDCEQYRTAMLQGTARPE
jgi:hypothetical protein